MQVTVLGLMALVIIFLSFRVRQGFILGAFAIAGLLQASAAVFIGSNGITPAHLLLVALVIACLRKGAAVATLLRFGTVSIAGMALASLGLYAMLTALFFPRLLAGVTNVNPIGDGLTRFNYFNPPPLAPSMGNLTQSIYVLGSFSVFFMVLVLCDKHRDYASLVKALVAYAIGNVVFGILDIVTYYTNTAFLFDVIRNANYTFHTEETAALGLKRISGSFTETSAFSAVTLTTFAFTFTLALGGIRKWSLLLLSGCEVLLLAFSTSSTALAGLPVVACVLWSASLWRLFTARLRPMEAYFVIISPLLVAALVSGLWLSEPARNAVMDMLNAVLFDKAASESGLERLAFNAQALTNFTDTMGLGAGLGSLRASSFVLALLASVGIPGALLFLCFLVPIFFAKKMAVFSDRVATFQRAARAACFASLVGASISGTSMELGLMFFMFAAAAYWPAAMALRVARATRLRPEGGPARHAFFPARTRPSPCVPGLK